MNRVKRPNPSELEQAILAHLSPKAGPRSREGSLYVKVPEPEPAGPDATHFTAGLFLSMPYLGSDRTTLDEAMADVRKAFKRAAIARDWDVDVVTEQAYSHRDEE